MLPQMPEYLSAEEKQEKNKQEAIAKRRKFKFELQLSMLAVMALTPKSALMLGPMYKRFAFRAGLMATLQRGFLSMAFRTLMGLSMMAALKEFLKKNKLAVSIYENFLKPKNHSSPTAKFLHEAFLFMVEFGVILMLQSAVGMLLLQTGAIDQLGSWGVMASKRFMNTFGFYKGMPKDLFLSKFLGTAIILSAGLMRVP